MCDIELNEKLDFSTNNVQRQHKLQHNLLRTLYINIASLLFLTLSVAIFMVYKTLVNVYLKFKLGNCYGGLLASEDLVFFMPDPVSKPHITTVIYARCKEKVDMLRKTKEIIQEKIFDNPDNYPKLTSTFHQFGGYYYAKKYNCNTCDVVKEIKLANDQELTEEYLKEYTAKVTNAEFGKNGTLLWEMHVAPCSIKKELNSTYTYPIITRFHHSVADGTCLVSLLIQVYGDKSCENYGEKLFNRLLKKTLEQGKRKNFLKWIVFVTTNLIKCASLYLEMIFISLGRIMESNQLKPDDINGLHGTNFTGEKLCAWASEDKIECIPLVRKIKNENHTKFSCVVSTAVAASLSHYFKRNDFPIPEFISGLIAILLDNPNINMSKPVVLRNKTGGTVFELPMIYESKTLREALKNISEEWNRQIRLADSLATTYLLRYMTNIPMSLLKLHVGWTAHTYIITSVPGGSEITTRDGWVFEKVIPIAPNILGIGVSIALLSYNEKFHIGVLVDKKLIQSQEEVQRIADDILFYIKVLNSQCK